MDAARPEIARMPEILTPSDRTFIAFRLLWEHRKFVLTFVLRGTLLALLIAFLIPATYESTTQLMPPDSQAGTAMSMLAALSAGTGGATGSASGGIGMAADLLGMKSSGALFVSVLHSDTVEDRLINRFDLRGVYWVKTYKSARKKLASRTDISEDRKSGVITITVTDRDPARAAALARAYVEELNHLVAELNTSAAHRERVFLEGRLKDVKEDLDRSSRDFSDFASKNTAIDIKEQGRAMVEAAAALQGQLIAAESELRGLEQIYTPNNVRVRSVQARIAELKRQLDKLGGDSSPEPNDSGSEASLYPSIRQLPRLGVPYADLYRRVRINETVFETLTKLYELAKVQEAKEVPSVKVLDVAQPPEKRSGPPRLVIVIAGAMLSLCFAAIWLFGSGAWEATDDNDPRKALLRDVKTVLTDKAAWRRAREASADVIPLRLRRRQNGQPGPSE
jgi:uncharacterized protein involved in exopolysaccharide biosynthesis